MAVANNLTPTVMAGERIALSIQDAADALGIGRTTLYELVAAKEIVPFKIGRRTLILRSEVQRIAETRAASAREEAFG